uniref:Uncharacterized protein n=1 Tax=Scleropages formosus TaxID=113540 RepID=A0A8C9RYD4_SCLFO
AVGAFKMLLRVIVSPQEIRRVTLQSVPESVKELSLHTNLGLQGNSILQFEDPDFGNELCNLTDIKDLPTDRATLKVLFTFSDSVSDTTLDTTSSRSPTSASSVEWPDPFVIPDFSHDAELQLSAANDAYARDGTVMVISKGVRSEILDKLDHYESVATALVAKHPCLREPGTAKGWYCWVFSLKFKMGNYRQRLMAAGCPQVLVNKRKRGQTSSKAIKKSKKGEIHYLPDPPEGQSPAISEENRKTMLLEVQKCDPHLQLLDELMTATFSQQRKEIIGNEPLISVVMDRWPALFNERQVTSEFSRIVTTDLLQSFLNGLDALVPNLLELYKAAASSSRRLTLSSLMQCVHKEVSCLMLFLNVAVVAEERIVLHDLRDVPTGFAMLMDTIYCLNLEYPRNMKYSFEFLQRVIMKIKPDNCSSKIHGLTNKLLKYHLETDLKP